MSLCSTVAAIAFLPLLIVIYIESSFTDDNLQIPFVNIFLTLLLLLIPVVIGVYIRHKSEDVAAKVEKMGSILGGVFLVAALIYASVENDHLFTQTWRVWFAAGTMQIIGSALGYGLGQATGLSDK